MINLPGLRAGTLYFSQARGIGVEGHPEASGQIGLWNQVRCHHNSKCSSSFLEARIKSLFEIFEPRPPHCVLRTFQ